MCRNPGLAIPLIGLQYHEVVIKIDFRPLKECLVGFTESVGDSGNFDTRVTEAQAQNMSITANGKSHLKFKSCKLYVDYVYLDTAERSRFAKEHSQYLIEQVQHHGAETLDLKSGNPTHNVRLNFNHPVKELIWVVQRQDVAQHGGSFDKNDWFNYSTAAPGANEPFPHTGDILYKGKGAARIVLNGHERFSSRPANYFRLVQPFSAHTRVPSKNIYCYSFALRPEEHNPTGQINMSRIDNAQLQLKLADNADTSAGGVFGSGKHALLYVFAVNYNVFKLCDGMGGVAFSS